VSEPAERDLLLVALAVCSGAVDAISYLALGKVFSAFMTGNVVFLAFGIAGAAGPDLARVVVALAAFAVGAVMAVRIVKPSRGSSIWPRRMSVALGCAGLVEVGFLVGWTASSGRPSTGMAHLLIGISSLAMGMQTGSVMSLGVRAVFTTAATATLVELAGDLAGWPQPHNEWARLAGVLGGICAGAVAGAVLLVHARGYAPVLPVLGTLSVSIAASRRLTPEH
jgi:uncharacterized membrane protein YoaK (UPF0700 family)